VNSVKTRLWPKQNWLRAAMLLLAVVLVPYVFSRLASPWRCLSIHAAPDVVSSKSPAPGAQLRIACYNIAHGRGVAVSNWDGGSREERTHRLDQIAELIRGIDADVLVLNEVDFDSSWSHSVNQAQYLAEKAGYPYWAEQRNLDFRILTWKWRFGNAVLSKYPISNARVVDLPGYSTWETVSAGKKRGLVCDITLGDQVLRVAGVHFSHRSESLRVRSAAALVDIATGSSLPTIVAGDLNSTPPGFPQSASDSSGNNAIAILDGSGRLQRKPIATPPTNQDLTYHSVEPRCVIDWILIPPKWRFVQYGVELSHLSDHRPVYADVAPARL
jgi:endonuclease/exonuclease/phosphatase family metal-dependent hydrolase